MADEMDGRLEEFLESEVQKYARMLRIYKRLDKVVSITVAATSICSLLLTSGTMGSALTGIGAAASLPLGSLACLSATTILVLSLIAKRIAKKKKKHRETLRLARSYQSQLPGEDGAPAVCLKNYYDGKDRLRQPSPPFSEDLAKHSQDPR